MVGVGLIFWLWDPGSRPEGLGLGASGVILAGSTENLGEGWKSSGRIPEAQPGSGTGTGVYELNRHARSGWHDIATCERWRDRQGNWQFCMDLFSIELD